MVRLKNRYIVLEINPRTAERLEDINIQLPFRLNENSVDTSILNKVQQLHGDFGTAAIRAGFRAKYCNDYTRIAVVRCRHGPHKLVTSSIPFINYIESKNVSVNILYIGASIKQCFNFVKIYQERKFDEFCVKLETNEDKAAFKDILLNFEKLLNTMTS